MSTVEKKKIKDYVKKPSEALRAMCRGLEKQSQRDDFTISMNTFGERRGDMCYGCAATCAVQEIYGFALKAYDFSCDGEQSWDQQASACNAELNDLARFELAIDHARSGDLNPLFRYFEITDYRGSDLEWVTSQKLHFDWLLQNSNWHSQLKYVLRIADKLESEGY